MIPRLLEQLRARVTLVVGKGGVGKSTAACAVALALADGGRRVHLLSTDPAHSLRDVLGEAAGGPEPFASVCQPRLIVEELDADGWARAWLDRAAPALAELVERGTYLEADEVQGFLDLALPGVDEVAGALRVAEIVRAGERDRVVVDTAPTGHLLRLLDAPLMVEGWLGAFGSMREKASAVAEALVRAPVRWAADDVLEDLDSRLAAFRRSVLVEGEALVVTAQGVAVARETERLERALGARRVRVAARLTTGVGQIGAEGPAAGGTGGGERPRATAQAPPTFEARAHRPPVGCEALRRWGSPDQADELRQRPGSVSRSARSAGAGDPRVRELLARGILLVAGKGGVGKSTCAAAASLELARDRRVALLGLDPAGSLEDVLATPVAPSGTRVAGALVRQVDASVLYEAFLEEHRSRTDAVLEGMGLGGGRGVDQRVLAAAWELAPPGMDEVFGMVEVLEASGRHDTLVVDAAPTGHFLRLLAMPELILAWTHQLLRVMLNARAVGALREPAERLLEFTRRVRELHGALTNAERTGVLVVTLDDPVVQAETSRLLRRLTATGLSVAAVLRNRSEASEATGEERGGSEAAWTAGALPEIRAPALGSAPVGPGPLLEFFAAWCRSA